MDTSFTAAIQLATSADPEHAAVQIEVVTSDDYDRRFKSLGS
jgi:hypothetical protein